MLKDNQDIALNPKRVSKSQPLSQTPNPNQTQSYLGKVPRVGPTLKFLLNSVFIAFLPKNFLRLQQSPLV